MWKSAPRTQLQTNLQVQLYLRLSQLSHPRPFKSAQVYKSLHEEPHKKKTTAVFTTAKYCHFTYTKIVMLHLKSQPCSTINPPSTSPCYIAHISLKSSILKHVTLNFNHIFTCFTLTTLDSIYGNNCFTIYYVSLVFYSLTWALTWVFERWCMIIVLAGWLSRWLTGWNASSSWTTSSGIRLTYPSRCCNKAPLGQRALYLLITLQRSSQLGFTKSNSFSLVYKNSVPSSEVLGPFYNRTCNYSPWR